MGSMPELPEVEALAEFLREHAAGHAIDRVDVSAFSALKTYDPPVSALSGRKIAGRPVVAAVQLVHPTRQVRRDRGDARRLERPGGDHYLVGLVSTVVGLDDEALLACLNGSDARVKFDG